MNRKLDGPITVTEDGVRVRLLVQSRASHTEIVGVKGDAVKIRVAAPPVDGAANEELVRFLADRLGCPKRAVELIQGQASRHKVVAVSGASVDAVSRALLSSG